MTSAPSPAETRPAPLLERGDRVVDNVGERTVAEVWSAFWTPFVRVLFTIVHINSGRAAPAVGGRGQPTNREETRCG